MHKVVAMDQMCPVIEEALRAGSLITLTVTGSSMLPMLRHQRDTVTLEPVTEPLRANDVVLYRRENGMLVLHRIVGIEKNGEYILCGDNQLAREHHVKSQQVIGRVAAFVRQNRIIVCTSAWYKVYVYALPALRFMRCGCFAAWRHKGFLRHFISRHANGNG